MIKNLWGSFFKETQYSFILNFRVPVEGVGGRGPKEIELGENYWNILSCFGVNTLNNN